jgi:hypothetical protein
MSTAASRTLIALALQLAALAVLGLAWLGTPWLDARSRPRLLVLVDRSQSVPRPPADAALADVRRAARASGVGELQLLPFAGKPALAGADDVAALEPAATDIEAALQAALAAHAQAAYAGAVIVSDGHATRGDTARALRAAREAGLPVQWLAVGRPPPETRITEVLAPDHAVVGQRLQLSVQLAGQLSGPWRVRASARSAGGETQVVTGTAFTAGRTTLELDAPRAGAVNIDVALEDADSGRVLDAWSDAAVVDIAPPGTILYAQAAEGSLARSLRGGGWPLDVVPPSRLDALADSLASYRAVVLEDIAIADASPRFWAALVAAVQQRGVGLVVLGGERSFARGGYRGSVLETVLPVLSEPPALDQSAAVMFAVDKSGSMGQGSAGVDRFQLAQRAVLETARGLGERDQLGLIVFDVAPRVLIPLGPAPAGAAVLARAWPASPNGGTQLAPALEAAIAELERSVAARRMLVIVTDGFTDGAPLAGLRARLAASRIEIIALAVGPDADVSALQGIVGPAAGLVLKVEQAAQLPASMRAGLERRRARVERGRIAVEQAQALPFEPGLLKDWPAVAAHHVTRPQAAATVAVQSERGEPVVAFHRSGRGRVVALTCGLGAWTPQWLRWREWPRLAGGLADWAAGTPPGAAALQVESGSGGSGGLQVRADMPAGAAGLVLEVDTPTTKALALSTEVLAPGRLGADLPDHGPGLYTFVLSTPQGAQRHLHLRRARGENEAWGINPALTAWQAEGLVDAWKPDAAISPRSAEARQRPPDRSLLALGLALFLAGVLVDRTRGSWPTLRGAVARWRRRAA